VSPVRAHPAALAPAHYDKRNSLLREPGESWFRRTGFRPGLRRGTTQDGPRSMPPMLVEVGHAFVHSILSRFESFAQPGFPSPGWDCSCTEVYAINAFFRCYRVYSVTPMPCDVDRRHPGLGVLHIDTPARSGMDVCSERTARESSACKAYLPYAVSVILHAIVVHSRPLQV